MMNIFRQRAVWVVTITAMFALGVWSTAVAQDKTSSPPPANSVQETSPVAGELSLDELKRIRPIVEDSQELGEPIKKSVLSLVDQAIYFLDHANQFNSKIEEITQKAKAAPDRLKEIKTDLDRPVPSPDSVRDDASKMKTDRLLQRRRKEEADLTKAKSNLSSLTEQLDKQKKRPEQLREGIAKAKQRLNELREELKAAPPPDEPPQVTKVRRMMLQAEEAKNQAEIESYEKELAQNNVLVSLLTAERDLAIREVGWREEVTKAWQARAQKRRQVEAARARVKAEKAKEEAHDLPPLVQEQFDINIQRGEELEKLTRDEVQVKKKLLGKQAQLKELEEEFSVARGRVEATVLTETIALALRQQRQSLPSFLNYRRDSEQRQLMMSEISETQFEIDRERRALADISDDTDIIIQSLGPLYAGEITRLQVEVQNLLVERRGLLDRLQAGYRRYFRNLQDLEFTEQQLATTAEQYADFLDERLIWIRSSKIIGLGDLRKISGALGWVASPTHWWQVMEDTWESFGRRPMLWLLGLLFGGALLRGRRWARRELTQIAERVTDVRKDSFALTLQALVMTLWLAGSGPFLMGFVGWRLHRLPFAYDFTQAASNGLMKAALVWITFGLFYHICTKDGLARAHFKWPDEIPRILRQNLLWLMPLMIFLVFLFAVIVTENNVVHNVSLGRLSFMAAMLAISVYTAWVLRLSGEIVSTTIKRRGRDWVVRLRFTWYSLAVGLPFVIAVLAAMGYYYTAVELGIRVYRTFWLAVGVILVNALILRWLFIAKRRIAFEEAERKREEEAKSQEAGEEAGDTGVDEETMAIEVPEIGLAQIDEHTRTLLRMVMVFSTLMGLWAIWRGALPALNILGDVQLWSHSAEVDGVAKTLPITLADLGIAIVVAVVTVVGARSLPGVLQITLLNRVTMDPGARYAITTMCRYVISAVGVVVAFSYIGVSWSGLQWLVAAMGVGLGFGLQEVVANFICGLIVLFERPYRLGDVVTVGDISGRITRIQIRATTITDWDRRELIVPNKEFITGRLINWSLSDSITRIKIPVGIAHGSDTELAERLLIKIAKENPLVLDEPEPAAFFLSFGEHSFKFDLMVFVSEMKYRLTVTHQLHQAIDREFQKAGIRISFPQRDVHLDASRPLRVHLEAEEPATEVPAPALDPDEESS